MRISRTSASPVLWFTGLSGAGKSTIASAVHQRFRDMDVPTEDLDGDIIRSFSPAGFTRAERDALKLRYGGERILHKHATLGEFLKPQDRAWSTFSEFMDSGNERRAPARLVVSAVDQRQFTGSDVEFPRHPVVGGSRRQPAPRARADDIPGRLGNDGVRNKHAIRDRRLCSDADISPHHLLPSLKA